jgi:hypothetical protein
MVARLRRLSHRSSIHSVVIKGNSAWTPTAIPAARPRVTSNANTSAMRGDKARIIATSALHQRTERSTNAMSEKCQKAELARVRIETGVA